MCKICLASEMPFFNSEFDLNDINHDHITQVTSNPSTMPDNIFECFKSKGLHFVHVNARSLYPKLSEIRLLAKKVQYNSVMYLRNLARCFTYRREC